MRCRDTVSVVVCGCSVPNVACAPTTPRGPCDRYDWYAAGLQDLQYVRYSDSAPHCPYTTTLSAMGYCLSGPGVARKALQPAHHFDVEHHQGALRLRQARAGVLGATKQACPRPDAHLPPPGTTYTLTPRSKTLDPRPRSLEPTLDPHLLPPGTPFSNQPLHDFT